MAELKAIELENNLGPDVDGVEHRVPWLAYDKDEADIYIAHQKRKRCLAMAKWCESENYTACWYHENSERCEWTEKWHKRWLALAEEPTWAKFLQLIHEEAK